MRRARGALVLPFLLFSAVAFAQEEWEYREGAGFVNKQTQATKSPDDFLTYADQLITKQALVPAQQAVELLLKHTPEGALKEKALLKRAQVRMLVGEPYEAYQLCENFISRYRSSERVKEAVRLAFDCAIRLTQVGYKESVLGIPLWSTSTKGIEVLKNLLERYPYEEFSLTYAMWLGDYHYRNGDLDEAKQQFYRIAELYKQDPRAAEALLKLAYCHLKRFEGADYDMGNTKEGRRTLETLLERYPKQELAAQARKLLENIRDKEAEKEYNIAVFYFKRGKMVSAKKYAASVVKHFPNTIWAKEAKAWLDKLAKVEKTQ